MPKHFDAVKAFDSFRAPWETEAGADAEIDKPKLKRYIHGLLVDKAKAQDASEEASEQVKALTTERDEAKEEAAKASPEEANKKIAKLEKQVTDLTTERDELRSLKELTDLRSEVLAGVDPKVAKYVRGTTKEELEESLKEVQADFGITSNEEESEEEDEEFELRVTPRARLTNSRDPKAGDPAPGSYDFDKVADEILGTGVL